MKRIIELTDSRKFGMILNNQYQFDEKTIEAFNETRKEDLIEMIRILIKSNEILDDE